MTRLAAFVAAALVAAAAVLVVILAARWSPGDGAPRVTAGDGAAVRVARTRLGRILVDARGHTLYLLSRTATPGAPAEPAARGYGRR